MMKRLSRSLFCLTLLAGMGGYAQEGHPLRGTWHGYWGKSGSRTDVTLVMDWDGQKVTGILNPGLRSVPLENTSLDPSKWAFHFEANYKDRSGAVSRVVVDANIQDVTNMRRELVGTWKQGSESTEFRVRRDN